MIEKLLAFFTEIARLICKFMEFSSCTTKKKRYTYIEEEKLRVEAVDFLKQITERCTTICPGHIKREYKVIGNDLYGTYFTEGIALKNNVSGIKHTLTSSKKQLYENMVCYGYDLLSSEPKQKIRPRLISPDGFSKVVELTLNKSLNKGDPFKEKYVFSLAESISYNRAYIISGINYKKVSISFYNVLLRFYDIYPQNVRVYRLEREKYEYLHTIYPISLEHELYESDCTTFADTVSVENPFSLILYVFDRKEKGEIKMSKVYMCGEGGGSTGPVEHSEKNSNHGTSSKNDAKKQ